MSSRTIALGGKDSDSDNQQRDIADRIAAQRQQQREPAATDSPDTMEGDA